MEDPQVFIDSKLSELLSKVESYKNRGWRFTNLCGSTREGKVELLYSFSQGEELENLRVLVARDEQVAAISPLYPCAFFFENETHDLYGVRFKGIIIDFEGSFYPTSVPSPMNPGSLAAEEYLASASASASASADGGAAVAAPELALASSREGASHG